MSPQMKQSFQLTPLEKRWVLYDVGNSAFILLVATILPIYFSHLASEGGLSETQYLAYWGYAISGVTILVALTGPILGSLADLKGMKVRFLLAFVLIGSICCAGLGLSGHWFGFLMIFMLAKYSYAMSIIFYDAMLIDVTDDKRMDKVSSYGYAFGYVGSCIPFIISLIFVLGYEMMGIGFGMAMTIAFFINGAWWLAMSLPLLKNFRQIHYVGVNQRPVNDSFKRLFRTLHDISKDKKIFFFLIAFFFYIDGVYTIIDMATAYGASLGLNSTGLLLALLLTQLVAFPCAIISGRLSQKYRGDILISISILAYTGIAIFAVFLRTQAQFWVLAVLVGMFQGGIQALSRSYFGKIIPPEKSGEYYGIMDICGKGAAFLGTMLVSTFTQITGNQSMGVAVIAPLIFVGFFFFRLSLRFPSATADKIT